MKTQRHSEINGSPVLRPAPQAVPVDDRLYRYVPVPPVYRDEDGYLVEDGMGQNTKHLSETSLWFHELKERLPTATVCSDLPMHYRQGDKNASLVPDLFVALQAPPQESRPSYKLWENPLPELVIEMLSEGNSENDVGPKQFTYEYLGVREYWLFDPAGFQLPTPLVGYRLRKGRYQPIEADAAGRLRSDVLGLDLRVRDDELRFRDPATGEDLATYSEAVKQQLAEKLRADTAERERAAERRGRLAEKNRADTAERERLVEKNRADTAERERLAEKNRADTAERKVDAAERKIDAAERELARLRLRLEGR